MSERDQVCEAWNATTSYNVGQCARSSAFRGFERALTTAREYVFDVGPSTTTVMQTDAPPEQTHLTLIPRTTIQGAQTLMNWRNRAACLEEDPELFFPIGNTGPALLQIEEAKAVCRRCEVTETCLKWAIESGQDAGVWGGLSEDERRALKRRNARARRAG